MGKNHLFEDALSADGLPFMTWMAWTHNRRSSRTKRGDYMSRWKAPGRVSGIAGTAAYGRPGSQQTSYRMDEIPDKNPTSAVNSMESHMLLRPAERYLTSKRAKVFPPCCQSAKESGVDLARIVSRIFRVREIRTS